MNPYNKILYNHNIYFDYNIPSLNLIRSFNEKITYNSLYGSNDISFYTVGSLGRCEITDNSDIDIYGISEADVVVKSDEDSIAKTAKCVYSIADQKYDIDTKCLKIYSYRDLVNSIGNSFDDYNNSFTARMTLILEGRCLYNYEQYKNLLNLVLEGYFNNRALRNENFPCVFLLDDILRYWKTLCVNYEVSYHNDSNKIEMKKISLRFSRSLMIFSTVLNIIINKSSCMKESDFFILSPLERLAKALGDLNDSMNEELFKEYLDLYYDFLCMKSENNILKKLEEDGRLRKLYEEKGDRCMAILYRFINSEKISPDLKKFLIM